MMTSSGVLDVTVPYRFGKHGLLSEEKKMGHGQKVQHCEWRVSIHAPAARLMSAADPRQRACAGVQDVKPGSASHPPCEVSGLFRSEFKMARESE